MQKILVCDNFICEMKKIKEKTLTEREINILKLVSEGKSNVQIGLELHISPYTVKAYLKEIFNKLGVKDRISASVKAVRENIL